MFIPLLSDAPMRHWPIATFGLIAINVIVFCCQPMMPEGWLTLYHGQGLYPFQWVSSMFTHGDIGHLVGNMVFLWLFGHVVEGRCGPILFPLLYLGIGVSQCALEQGLMLFAPADNGSMGASSAIYGIMMLAGLWAARTNVHCFYFFFYGRYVGWIEVPTLIFAAFYFLWDFGLAMLMKFAMATPLLHIMGAVIGLVVGVVFLFNRWVDCEGLDVRTILEESTGKKEKTVGFRQAQEAMDQKRLTQEVAKENFYKHIHSADHYLKARQLDLAFAQIQSANRIQKHNSKVRQRAKELIQQAQKSQQWEMFGEASHFFLEQFSNPNDSWTSSLRINLAQLVLQKENAPRRALEQLRLVDQSVLDSRQRESMGRIAQRARAMISDGHIEIPRD